MNAGKEKCEILKGIRKAVAEQYGLEYTPAECTHEGGCPGTCPQCDAELRDLQQQLEAKGIVDMDIDDIVEIPQMPQSGIFTTAGLVLPTKPGEKRFPMDLQGLPPLEGDISSEV